MNICILSSSPKVGSTRRLKEVLRGRGHKVRVLHPLGFRIVMDQGRPSLFYEDKPLGKEPEAVIPRIGHSKTFFGTSVVRQFEQMGIYSLNSAHAITLSRNKLRALQQLSKYGVGIPRTVFVPERSSLRAAIDLAGGAPVVIKLLEGTQGIGVILAETEAAATAILETMQSTKQDVLVQRFIHESRGRDVRALVVGGKVIAAVRRTAQAGEFRSNVHRGATAAALTLEPAYEQAAIRAAQILGLEMAGVDMLESEAGPKVMEVNSSPSIAGIEEATGLDLATPIVDHIEAAAPLPPVDIRQRLTLPHGHGVADVPVPRGARLIGKSLRDTGLRDHGVQVLSVQRGAEVFASPRGDFQIEADDVLLCFGPLEAIRAQLTPRKRKRALDEQSGSHEVSGRVARQEAEEPAPRPEPADAGS